MAMAAAEEATMATMMAQKMETAIIGPADLGAAKAHHDEVAGEGAKHEDFAVGEVNQLEDPVDHRVAEGEEGIDAAGGQSVDGLIEPEVG